MRVLIAGAGGQIGRALAATAPPAARVRALGRVHLDLTRPEEVVRAARDFRPDLVVNAAGYTAVDRAETEPEAARAVNQEGTRHLAEAAAAVRARMLHFSTDYVFDGSQRHPYAPGDRPNPLNMYGASKLAGERALLDILADRAVVVRTAWVYAATGRNFLSTMLRLLKQRDQVRVVSDQIGTPTSAPSIARAAWAISDRWDIHGITHWTDDGIASWYDFAVAIQEEGLEMGLLQRRAAILPIATVEYPTPACRPRYSVLDCTAARSALGMAPDHWRAELRRILERSADA